MNVNIDSAAWSPEAVTCDVAVAFAIYTFLAGEYR